VTTLLKQLTDELSPAERKLTRALALASRALSQGGHDDLNQGQVSARLPGSGEFFIKSALCGFNEARPEDMLRVSVDHALTPPKLAPPELPLHQSVYAARPDVNAIVHSHAPYSLVFGATDWEIRPLSHDGAYFARRVPRFTATTNTVLDQATGDAIAGVLADAPAAFLRNHGLLVVAKSVREVAVMAQVLERATQLQILAETTGATYACSDLPDVEKKREFIYSATAIKSYWDYCTRCVIERWPEASDW
jgi:L-fuculose-phosphate aldolase